MSSMNSRRQFVKKGVLGVAAGSMLGSTKTLASVMDSPKADDLKLGFAGYTFVHFNLEEALKMIKKV
jgi:inosose dehydratase